MTNVQNYITVFDTSGKRITSYCPEVHGKAIDELLTWAQGQYPGKTVIKTTPEDNAKYVSGYFYDSSTESPVAPAEPTEEEKKQEALNSLDSEYSQKFADLDDQIVKASALGDDDLKSELITERKALVSEYTEKRGEI